MAKVEKDLGLVTGATGPAGKDANITSATGTVTPGHLDKPTVQVVVGGEPAANTLQFTFAGLQGEKGDTGQPGPKGDDGPKGDAGTNGENGAPGKDAKISAVNVTVNPGHSDDPTATAEVSGDAGDQTVSLTFSGLQGAPGADGKQGADGAPGKDGAEGAAGKDANITAVNVTVNPGHSESPTAKATVTGDAGDKTIGITFDGLQGATGPAGPAGKDFKPGGTASQLVLGDGSTKDISTFITENIEAIRTALGLATTEHMGLVPQLPQPE